MNKDKMPRIPEGARLAEIDNERYVACWTNNDPTFQPLAILLPQWSTTTLKSLSIERQQEIVDEFTDVIADAWEKLMRAK